MPARAAAAEIPVREERALPVHAWAIVALLACVPFLPALNGPFVFDDHLMLRLPEVARADSWPRLFSLLETRPLTFLTFWANHRFAPVDPRPWHNVNLLLHVLNSLLVLLALRAWIPARTAWIAAALFAVHPLQVEPVAYIFARSTLLSATFCLGALWTWARGRYWWSVALFALGMLAKEECAAFPLMLGILHWAGERDKAERRPIAAMLAIAVAAGLRVLYATSVVKGAGAGFAAGNSPVTYLTAQGISIWRYLRLIFIPSGLTPDTQIDVTPALAAMAWIALAAVTGVAIWKARTFAPALWFLCALLLLAPSSSILPADDLAADRRMYLPLVAFSAAAALLIDRAPIRPAIFIAVPLLGALSWVQAGVWTSEYKLWQYAAALAPGKARPFVQLARAASPADAEAILRSTVEKFPQNAEVWNELGQALLKQQRAGDALSAFGRALALAPGDGKFLNNRGVALAMLGQRDAAIADFRRAVAAYPCLTDAHENLRKLDQPSDVPPKCP